MGDSLFNFSDATIYIDGYEVSGISDFEMDFTASDEYIEEIPIKRLYTSESFTATCKFNPFLSIIQPTTFTYAFLSRWLQDSCSNRRVAWLIKHGKNKRIRTKNLKRAYHIVSEKYIEELMAFRKSI